MVLYVEEIFPTAIKNVAIGFYFAIGLIGGVLAPFIVSLSTDLKISPVGSFGVIGLFAILIILSLKETLNKPIHDQIKEVQRKAFSFTILS